MLTAAPLYHQLAEQIHTMIRSGTLRAGEKVPSVRRLSAQQQVSVSTVLQAYQKLEDAGVIEARPQSGYYVRRPATPMAEPAPSKPPQRPMAVEVNAIAEAMLAAGQDPRMVSFGPACPQGELFPLERIRRVLASRARAATACRSGATASRPARTRCAARSRAARSNGAAASTTATWSPPTAAWRR